MLWFQKWCKSLFSFIFWGNVRWNQNWQLVFLLTMDNGSTPLETNSWNLKWWFPSSESLPFGSIFSCKNCNILAFQGVFQRTLLFKTFILSTNIHMNFLCVKGLSVSKFSTCSTPRHSLKNSTNLGWIYENLHSHTNQPFQFVSQLISSTTCTTPNETSSLGWLRERPHASNVKNPRIPPSTQCCWWKKSWDV